MLNYKWNITRKKVSLIVKNRLPFLDSNKDANSIVSYYVLKYHRDVTDILF